MEEVDQEALGEEVPQELPGHPARREGEDERACLRQDGEDRHGEEDESFGIDTEDGQRPQEVRSSKEMTGSETTFRLNPA